MSKELIIYIAEGDAASFTTDSVTSGNYVRLPDPGGTAYTPTAFAVSTTTTLGPFNEPRTYKLYYDGTDLTVTQTGSGVYTGSEESALDTRVTTLEAYTTTSNVGTAATNVSAAEYGDAYQHTTVLTVTNAVLPAITGGAAEAEGVLLYTLPAGAVVVDKAYMSLSIQQQDGNITADTPDGGLGTLQASGAQATLDAVDAAAENIITGQTFDDCDGTAEVKTISNQILTVEAAADHTVYFNVADTWAASGDTGALVSGTVVLHWQFIA